MALEDEIRKIVDRLDTVPEDMLKKVGRTQEEILNEVLSLVSQLGTDAGNILVSSENLEAVDQIIDQIRSIVLDSSYVDAIETYGKEFQNQKDINDGYLQDNFDNFAENDTANLMLTQTRKTAVRQLLELNPNLYAPIRNNLDQAVSTGASLRDTMETIRLDIVGGVQNDGTNIQGRLLRHSNQIVFDAFAQADRQYTTAMGEELGVEWYFYAGGTIEPVGRTKKGKAIGGTRPFCEARNGVYWHKNEVESWVTKKGEPKPSFTWDGKIKQTDKRTIFTFLGGWNCRHVLMPVSPFVVPKERILDAMAKGFYQPDEKTTRALQLDLPDQIDFGASDAPKQIQEVAQKRVSLTEEELDRKATVARNKLSKIKSVGDRETELYRRLNELDVEEKRLWDSIADENGEITSVDGIVEYNKLVEAVRKEQNDIHGKILSTQKDFEDEVFQVLKQDTKAKNTIRKTGTVTRSKEINEKVTRSIEYYQGIVGDQPGLRGKTMSIRIKDGRAFYRDSDKGARVSSWNNADTITHELAHNLEYEDREGIFKEVQEFYRKRAGNEKPRKMSDLTGNQNYESWEVAIEDDYIKPYMGKLYGRDNRGAGGGFDQRATEIITMWFTEVFTDPARLINKDPEYFNFVFKLLNRVRE